jgi:hypothetical protein
MRHLTTESLIELAEGRLSPQSKRFAEQHIETCAMCFAEASEWVSLLADMQSTALESAPDWVLRNCFALYQISKPVSKLKQLFATVLFDSTMASAAVGVRGVADSQQIVFRGADVDVHLRIGGNPRVILGQMLRREANHFLDGIPVTLLHDGQQIEATITDTLGEFRFGTAPSGAARLQVDLPEYRLLGDFRIKEEEIN